MNRIVRDHYPASKLPEDLREGIDPAAEVVVTVEAMERPQEAFNLDEVIARRRPPFLSDDEVVRMIREYRDGSDD